MRLAIDKESILRAVYGEQTKPTTIMIAQPRSQSFPEQPTIQTSRREEISRLRSLLEGFEQGQYSDNDLLSVLQAQVKEKSETKPQPMTAH